MTAATNTCRSKAAGVVDRGLPWSAGFARSQSARLPSHYHLPMRLIVAKPKTTANPERTKRTMAFLSDSLTDYLAARTLFLSQLPVQAAVLSSTAIEKACKAILAFHGNSSHGHLQKAHWNAVRQFDPRLFGQFDAGFLALNKKVYSLRYTDDLPTNFNLVIASREYLSALDDTLVTFFQSFRVGPIADSEERPVAKWAGLIEKRDQRLVVDNHVLAGVERKAFVLAKPQLVYEVRCLVAGSPLEMLYSTARPPRDSSFLREGVRVVDPVKRIFEMSHFPIDPRAFGDALG